MPACNLPHLTRSAAVLAGAAALTLLAAACDRAPSSTGGNVDPSAPAAPGDALAFAVVGQAAAQGQADPILALQVALDRAGFSPGVIDGVLDPQTRKAIAAFQEARGLQASGQVDEATRQALFGAGKPVATRRVRIPAAFARGPFYPGLPKGTAEQAGHGVLGYRSMTEALAERFHTTPAMLVRLNGTGKAINAGTEIVVPAIDDAPAAGGDLPAEWQRTLALLGVGAQQPAAERIEVDKSEGMLRAYDAKDRLIGAFPVTTGSEHDPLPLGEWKIKGTARNPTYHYNPDLFWDAGARDEKAVLQPGPNGPVGVVWIDLSKDHYGLHGTPEPATIGKTESHGCVRLTNWDAARLAQMVSPGVKVVFVA